MKQILDFHVNLQRKQKIPLQLEKILIPLQIQKIQDQYENLQRKQKIPLQMEKLNLVKMQRDQRKSQLKKHIQVNLSKTRNI